MRALFVCSMSDDEEEKGDRQDLIDVGGILAVAHDANAAAGQEEAEATVGEGNAEYENTGSESEVPVVSGGRSDGVVEEEVQLGGAAGDEQEELLILNVTSPQFSLHLGKLVGRTKHNPPCHQILLEGGGTPIRSQFCVCPGPVTTQKFLGRTDIGMFFF